MPLWRIFSHADTFTPAQRTAFAKDITEYYVDKGLPAFYVNVFFIPLEAGQCFVGGIPKKKFVRIAIERVAGTIQTEIQKLERDIGREAWT